MNFLLSSDHGCPNEIAAIKFTHSNPFLFHFKLKRKRESEEKIKKKRYDEDIF